MANGARITKMEMRGFKSFANPTQLVFGEKFNCVLGPNGSGKSNIMDALVFVLGKSGSKSMRAEKTANLIYNGGKSKSPAKEGIVSIYFDNSTKVFGSDFSELKITRTVKQNGQSDYLINDQKVTRQEVVEMLEKARINPDGHNIILQGDIIHLIEMSGLERRTLVEEIAGIGVYEDKKEKALKELERVEERLNETQIILTEREVYLRELKNERDQALQFKELQDKLRRNKKTVASLRAQKKGQERDKYEAAVQKHQTEIAQLSGEIEDLKSQIAKHRQEIDEINKEIERKGEKEQVALHKEVEGLRVETGVKKARADAIEVEMRKVDERKATLVKTNQELFDKIKYIEEEKRALEKDKAQCEQDLAQLAERISQFKKKHAVDDAGRIDKQIEQIDQSAEKLQEELSMLRAKQQEQMREKDRIDIRLEQADAKIAHVLETEQANRKQIEELKRSQDAFKAATKELQLALSEDASFAGQIGTARTKVAQLTEQLMKLRAERATIKEGASGGIAISKVLEQKDKIRGIIGTVAELGSVQKEHQLALEIAAGGRITGIVVEDEKTAGECIDFLRKGQFGVATFLPLGKLRAPVQDESLAAHEKKPGVIGLATRLVQYDARYDTVFRFVLGNTLVVESLDVARKIGIGKARMVTLQGDLADSSGSMQGGYRAKSRAGMGFQEKELAGKVEKLEVELGDAESVLGRVERKRSDNEKAIERLREHKAQLEAQILALEKLLHIDSKDLDLDKEMKKKLQEESKQIEKALDGILGQVSEANRSLAQRKMEKQALRDQITQLRSPQVLAQLASFEEKQAQIKDHLAEIAGKAKMSDAQLVSVLGPEAERIKGIMKQQDKEVKEFAEERQGLLAQLESIGKVLAQKEELEKKFLAQFKDLFKKREHAAREITQRESDVEKRQLKIRDLEVRMANAGMELARTRAELAGIEEELRLYGDLEPFEGKKEEDCLVEIKEFERMLEGIGAVNMKALDMYDSVEREYKELVDKKGKLSLEREDVLVMINEIDSRKSDIFRKTFTVLNENFQRIFTALSAKGEAYLELENEKDIFSGGVAIKVRLTGKKFLDIRSLSGGEKTMTALSFLFAVQEYEPAHFYVLDEVDAALDKHNSEKLAKLVRAYCTNAQYLVISHNDSVISEADSLYGISMNEHGISKVTTLEI